MQILMIIYIVAFFYDNVPAVGITGVWWVFLYLLKIKNPTNPRITTPNTLLRVAIIIITFLFKWSLSPGLLRLVDEVGTSVGLEFPLFSLINLFTSV